MPWTKVPPEHHPLFLSAVPEGPDIEVVRMFGSLCVLVNGHMACGLFAHSFMARLGPDDLEEALALDGATPFDPMNSGRAMHHTVMFPDGALDDRRELHAWIRKAVAHTRTLPPKPRKRPGKPTSSTSREGLATSTKKPTSKKPATKKPATKKPATKKPASKKPATKKPAP